MKATFLLFCATLFCSALRGSPMPRTDYSFYCFGEEFCSDLIELEPIDPASWRIIDIWLHLDASGRYSPLFYNYDELTGFSIEASVSGSSTLGGPYPLFISCDGAGSASEYLEPGGGTILNSDFWCSAEEFIPGSKSLAALFAIPQWIGIDILVSGFSSHPSLISDAYVNSTASGWVSFTLEEVPEPGTFGLLGAAAGLLFFRNRRINSRSPGPAVRS